MTNISIQTNDPYTNSGSFDLSDFDAASFDAGQGRAFTLRLVS